MALDMGTQNVISPPVKHIIDKKYVNQYTLSGTTRNKNKKAPSRGQRTINSYFHNASTCQINLTDPTPANPRNLNIDEIDICPSIETQGNVEGKQSLTDVGPIHKKPHEIREPLLFNDSTSMQFAWTLDENKRPIRKKLEELIVEHKTHDMKILKASLARIESQMGNPDFVKRTSTRIMSNTHDLSLQEEDTQMPSGARSSWNHARNAAVEAAKATNQVAYYKEAPLQGLHEYWCFGLERIPRYLMKIPEFRAELHSMRMRHAKEEMKLAATHLENEVTTYMDSSANMRSAAVTNVQQTSPDRGEVIIQNASIAYDITVANMSGNEFKELDLRRQTLQDSPPTVGDIIDPVSNVTKTTAKATEDKGFRRGRGRGGSRPRKPYKDRKPYNRSNQKK